MNAPDSANIRVSRRATAVLAALVFGLPWSPFSLAQAEDEQQKVEGTQDADAVAQSAGGEMSADAAAKALANPAGSLANLANNLTYRTFKGDLPDAGSQTAITYTFQPVLPFPVGDKGNNIIVRPALTVSFDQPIFDSNTGTWDTLSTQFNDIVFDTVYSGTTMTGPSTGYLWGVGVAGTLPTATHKALGGEQWRLGPEIFTGVVRDWGVAGGLVSNQWNLGGGGGGPGSGDEPYSTTTIQYFYGIGLGNGWQILSGPVISYDWNASSSEALSLPLGTGIAKITKIGDTTWRFQVELQYYVKQPDSFGSDWSLTFDFRPVIQNPLLGWFQ
jgi:hypothetical protein